MNKKTYYSNGQISRDCNYLDGKYHGESKGWHETGKVSFIYNYHHGITDGIQKSFFSNVLNESFFINGIIEGEFVVTHYEKNI